MRLHVTHIGRERWYPGLARQAYVIQVTNALRYAMSPPEMARHVVLPHAPPERQCRHYTRRVKDQTGNVTRACCQYGMREGDAYNGQVRCGELPRTAQARRATHSTPAYGTTRRRAAR